jgi:hypothetical protein
MPEADRCMSTWQAAIAIEGAMPWQATAQVDEIATSDTFLNAFSIS